MISILAAVIPTVVYVFVLWWFDRYEREPRRLLFSAFFWGAVPAVLLAVVAEEVLGIPAGALGAMGSELVSSSFLAPLFEEVAKGLAVFAIFLLFRCEFDDVLDGIIYGATVGFFAMTENVFYFLSSLESSGVEGLSFLVLMRAAVFGLNHALFTAIFGATLGYARTAKSGGLRVLVPVLGLLGAMFLHGVHNLFAVLTSVTCFSLLLGLLSDWGGVLVIFVVIALAWQQEKRWISTNLQPEVDNGLLTQAEYDMIRSYRNRLKARWQAWSRGDFGAARQLGKLSQLATELAFKVEQGDERTAQKLRAQIAAVRGLPAAQRQ